MSLAAVSTNPLAAVAQPLLSARESLERLRAIPNTAYDLSGLSPAETQKQIDVFVHSVLALINPNESNSPKNGAERATTETTLENDLSVIKKLDPSETFDAKILEITATCSRYLQNREKWLTRSRFEPLFGYPGPNSDPSFNEFRNLASCKRIRVLVSVVMQTVEQERICASLCNHLRFDYDLEGLEVIWPHISPKTKHKWPQLASDPKNPFPFPEICYGKESSQTWKASQIYRLARYPETFYPGLRLAQHYTFYLDLANDLFDTRPEAAIWCLETFRQKSEKNNITDSTIHKLADKLIESGKYDLALKVLDCHSRWDQATVTLLKASIKQKMEQAAASTKDTKTPG
jgi:hypothetical protein